MHTASAMWLTYGSIVARYTIGRTGLACAMTSNFVGQMISNIQIVFSHKSLLQPCLLAGE